LSSTSRRGSIHDLSPLESGGVEARQGFGLQDHVAAGFCLDMIGESRLVQVWCETQDDITLILDGQGGHEVEFVQVKGHDLDQLWSVAKLYERERKNTASKVAGRSILEKSLSNDRCVEPCSFRIVTCRPVQSELSVLTHPLGSSYRSTSEAAEAMRRLIEQLQVKLGQIESENGNGIDFWSLLAKYPQPSGGFKSFCS